MNLRRLVTGVLFCLAFSVPLFAQPATPPAPADACAALPNEPLFLTAENGDDPVIGPVVDPRLCVRRCNQVVRACFSFCGTDAACQASCDANHVDCLAACPGGGL